MARVIFFPTKPWVVLLFLLTFATARGQGYIRSYLLGAPSYRFIHVSERKDGGLVLSGEFTATSGANHSRNLGLNAQGDIGWQMDTPILIYDYKKTSCRLGDSLYFDAGCTVYPEPFWAMDAFLFCHDAAGNVLWTMLDSSSENNCIAVITASAAGGVYTMGTYVDPIVANRVYVQRFDLAGHLIWRKDFVHVEAVEPMGAVALVDGSLFFGLSIGDTPWLIHLDEAGDAIMRRKYSGQFSGNPFVAITLMADGNLLCTGSDTSLRVFSFNGDLLHSQQMEVHIRAAMEAADGDIIVVCGAGSDYDMYMQRFQHNWIPRWKRYYDWSHTTAIAAITPCANGDIALVGSMGSEGLLIRTDCEGNITDYRACLPPQAGFALWPNPNDGLARLAIPADATDQLHTVQVYDAMGKRVLATSTIDAPFLDLDLSLVDQGVYFLRVLRGTETVWQSRWTVLR